MRVQLSEEDRTKYGAPEWLEFEWARFGLKLVDDLEEQVGWTVEDFQNGLFRKAKNGDGEVVYSPRPKALAALAWLALRISGNRIAWNDFDISPIGLRLDMSSGKAEETTEESDPPSG